MESLSEKTGALEFKKYCASELEECESLLQSILRHRGARTRRDTLDPLNQLTMVLGSVWNLAALVRSVHPDAALRAAAEDCEKDIARFSSDLGLNRELYDVLCKYDQSTLDPVGARMLDHVLRDFRRSGVDRDEPARERVRVLREELVVLGQEFLRNILTDVRYIVVD